MVSRSLSSLLALLPPGRAWTRAPGTRLHDLMTAIAQEFDRLEARAGDLVREAIPTQAVELLEEWEALTRADECVAESSIEARQAAVGARLVGGTPTEALTTATAEAMGYTPTYEYFLPFVVGRSTAGEPLSNDEWQHTIGITVTTRTPGDDAILQCTIERLQHLHVYVLWTFAAMGALLTEDGLELLTEDGLELHAE